MLARCAGSLWFGVQSALAGRIRHLDAGVTMETFRRGLEVNYHGLGGTLARHVVGDAGHGCGNRLSAAFSSGLHDLLAWLDPEQVHLPRSIDRYPTRALNHELFLWLAAFMAEDRPLDNIGALPAGVQHLLRGVATCARIERAFPALGQHHARFCAAELAQRAQVLPGWHSGFDRRASLRPGRWLCRPSCTGRQPTRAPGTAGKRRALLRLDDRSAQRRPPAAHFRQRPLRGLLRSTCAAAAAGARYRADSLKVEGSVNGCVRAVAAACWRICRNPLTISAATCCGAKTPCSRPCGLIRCTVLE